MSGYKYQSCYCEENIWQLCQHPDLVAQTKKVLFISNPAKQCVIWHQRLSRDNNKPVIWDYHVVLLTFNGTWKVWDFDSKLPFGCEAKAYLNASFGHSLFLAEQFAPKFNLYDSADYIKRFHSDRNHMLDDKGQYKAKPPSWQAILSDTEDPLTLDKLTDMNQADALDLAGLMMAIKPAQSSAL